MASKTATNSSPVDDMDKSTDCPLASRQRKGDINPEGTSMPGSTHSPAGSSPDPNPSIPNHAKSSESSGSKTSDKAGATSGNAQAGPEIQVDSGWVPETK